MSKRDANDAGGLVGRTHQKAKRAKRAPVDWAAIYGDTAILFTKKHPVYGAFSNFVGGAEQEFQASKFDGIDDEYAAEIRNEVSPAKAKKMGGKKGKIKLNDDQIKTWNAKRVEVMRRCLRMKICEGSDFAALLLSSGDRLIVEKSFWDSFWGSGRTGKGENRLGKLLMARRSELRAM